MLQRPQDVQRPEQPTGPESTGFVRWYVVCKTLPSSSITTALNVVEPMSIPKYLRLSFSIQDALPILWGGRRA
jgi:hypothetical protein